METVLMGSMCAGDVRCYAAMVQAGEVVIDATERHLPLRHSWILNDQTYTRSIGDFMIWFCFYDLWSKVHVFGDMFKIDDAPSESTRKSCPANMLDSLETSFNEQQLEALRLQRGKSKEGTKHLLNVWRYRGFVTYSNQTGLYTKTEEYLKR